MDFSIFDAALSIELLMAAGIVRDRIPAATTPATAPVRTVKPIFFPVPLWCLQPPLP